MMAIILAPATSFAASIVPQPRSIVPGDGAYALPAALTLSGDPLLVRRFGDLAARIAREHACGMALRLRLAGDAALGREGYRLVVDTRGIEIDAPRAAGIFYGLQTLDQLLPQRGTPNVDAMTIVDAPAYPWRGIHLDVSRHFFSIAVLKRYIDIAARYKLNVFHLHLDDDQGWRLQIVRYPRLTSVGSCRAQTEIDSDATEYDGKRYCGFYTQAQIRDLVAYAARRFVTIVPEIEMPGHSQAAIAAYPRLSCPFDTVRVAGTVHVMEHWGGGDRIFCPTEYTFTFLENVLREVMALFPSTYIHIGGDEVPKAEWRHSAAVHALMKREHLATYDAVQGYFDRRIEAFLNAHGRRMIGWDEILDGGVSRRATIMSWRGTQGGIKAARAGNDVVMSPDGPLYFDAYQGDPNDEPEAIGNLSSTQDVYEFEPTPQGLTPAQRRHIIGVQGNVWTEYIATPDYLFYMLLPRMLALSEIAWSDPQPRNWDDFELRMGAQLPWLAAHGYTFRIPNPEFSLAAVPLHFSPVSSSVRTVRAETSADSVTFSIASCVPGAVIHYTADGTPADAKSPVYAGPQTLSLAPLQRIDIQAVVVLPDGRVSTPSELIVTRSAS
jgi:hexosaminidase